MRVIVTGGLGRLARPVLAALVSEGYGVVAFDQDEQSVDIDAIEVVIGDVEDRKELRKAANGCQCMLHLAAVSGESEASELLRTNVAGTYSALWVSRDLCIERFVMTSSAPVHLDVTDGQKLAFPLVTGDDDDHLYDLTKTLQEVLVKDFSDHGLQSLCLRIGHVVDGTCDTDLEGRRLEELEYCRGGWVDIDDVCNALVAAVSAPLSQGFTIMNLISSLGARKSYRVERTLDALNIKLSHDFARYR